MTIEELLTGGHPNSLGNTVKVVDMILAGTKDIDELFSCYKSSDEVVRLRVSNALKRIAKVSPELVIPFIDGLLGEVQELNQPSAQWSTAQLMLTLEPYLTKAQLDKAKHVLKDNLTKSQDWIVLNMTMQTLTDWAAADEDLRKWLLPRLTELKKDSRRSVSARARKFEAKLEGKLAKT
jgi:hypothetical protein